VPLPPSARRRRSALPLLCCVLLAACSRENPATASPPLVGGAPPPPPAPLSRFSVPLAYDFTSMLAVVERAVPRTLGSLDSVRMIGTDERRHYAFEAHRERFTAFAQGRELHLRAVVAYEARGYYKPIIGPTLSAGCGDHVERPRIVMELATPLTLTVGWRLASRARLVRLAPASTLRRDRCDVGILNTDVTDRVVEAATAAVVERLPAIDRLVGDLDLRDQFEAWWTLLGQPIGLADGVWLLLRPEQLRMGRVRGEARTLHVPVTLDARPHIVTSVAPPRVSPPPLPPLGRDTTSTGYHILLDGLVDYGTASRALTAALGERSITHAGRTIRVDSVHVRPVAQGKLELAVRFTGDARGTLRLVGTPRYDDARRELTVPDLDYALSVNDRLVRTFAWLRDDALRATFRERAHFPVHDAVQRGRTLLLAGLNRRIGDAMTLSATVDRVAVQGLYVTVDGLVVRAEASGQAAAAVKP
jgi:hypothetical protein